ncbi:MAG TPA: NYN domain-containing protein [Synergistales bacterium]|nr:NYN domain-containing protein [Synergistales bacterium]
MEYIAIFIDGAYLQKIVNSISSNNDRLDMEKLVLWIAGDLPIRRVYYYDCLPYQSDPASDAERERVSKKQKFFRVLERIDRFEVRLGRLEKRGEDVSGKPIFDQKRVDLQMGLDFAFSAYRQKIAYAALLSGDSDLCPAIEAAKNEGVITRLIHGPRGSFHNQLWSTVDERREITSSVFDNLKLDK